MTGQRFGLLTVEHRVDGPNRRRTWWQCRCDCGATAVKMGKYLRNGDTRSCGCVQRKYRATGAVKHGGARIGRLTPEYISWRDAKERCANPHKRTYRLYGGRGIRMCDAWRTDFAAFRRDMGPRPAGYSLDRIDVDGHYEPGNCRWVSQMDQCNNQRRNIRYSIGDESLTMAQIARRFAINYHSLYEAVRTRGEPVMSAVTRLSRSAA